MPRKTKQEKTLTPKLRFPKFKNGPGWQVNPLGLQVDFYKGRGISKAEIDASGQRPCIRYGELYTRYGEVIKHVYSRTNAPDDDLFLSREGDVIIPASGETKEDIATASCVMLDDVALGSDLNVIRTKHDGQFLSYFLNGKRRLEIAKIAQGDAVVHLYPSQLENVPIAFPDVAEQRKVAACLASLDELIAAEGLKLDALRAHKKGLMQQLFPREGESRPCFRFPEFRNAREWEQATVGTSCRSFSGGTPTTIRKDYYGGTIPFIRSAEIGSESTELFLTREGLNNSAAKMVDVGDVLVALYGANSGDVALARVSGAINQAILCLRPEGDRAFLCHYLTAKKGFILRTYIQGGQGNLSGEIVKSVELRFPSGQEQKRVADCLSSLDALIEAATRKLNQLRAHKKGLMQQLFPSPERG